MSRSNSLQAALAGAAVDDKPAQKPKARASKQSSKVAAKKQTPAEGRAVTTAKQPKPARTAAANGASPRASQPAAKATAATESSGRYRDSTVMVGGHFPPHVLRQLRMIAAEEDTTNQALIAEALDLLFLKKGKEKITDLSG